LAICQGFIAKLIEAGLLEGVAVKHVVGIKRDKTLAVGMSDVNAGFLDTSEIEGLGVDELDDEDAEEVFVAEVFGGEDGGSHISDLPTCRRISRSV
jgi:hypothetical protein